MDYKKAYYSLIERLKEAKEDADVCDERYCCVIDGLIQEPEENEDERIRETLIDYFKTYKKQEECGIKTFFGIPTDNVLAWLEKQGKKPQGKSALEAIHEQRTDNANKVERKFKVGDYIVNDYCKGKVIELTTDAYLLDTEQGIPFSCEHNAHLWTLADAREGDVLFSPNHNILWIYMDKEQYHAAINLNYANFVSFGADIVILSDVQPATREQRELLFSKMKEAGYVFDFENKQLKKIENPADWSEEDERNLQNVDSVLFHEISLSEDECMRLRNWLQSLKERAVWKPTEEQLYWLKYAANSTSDTEKGNEAEAVLKELYEQLKKL